MSAEIPKNGRPDPCLTIEGISEPSFGELSLSLPKSLWLKLEVNQMTLAIHRPRTQHFVCSSLASLLNKFICFSSPIHWMKNRTDYASDWTCLPRFKNYYITARQSPHRYTDVPFCVVLCSSFLYFKPDRIGHFRRPMMNDAFPQIHLAQP